MAKEELWVVAQGNPFDGISLTGPFGSAEEANDYAEDIDDDWWVMEVDKPK